MKESVRVICHHAYGEPEAVASVERWPLPEIKPNEVLVMMKAAPVSYADLNLLEGTYAVRPPLPAVPGVEGVGVVAQKGIAVSDLRVGQHVIRPACLGSWCEAYVAPASELVPIPPGIPVAQAAMATSILPTAWRMLRDFVTLQPGGWLIQNAANSAVGRFVIQIAVRRGWRTVNVVRRSELKAELSDIGADVVVTEEEFKAAEPGHWTEGSDIRLGLNAVGGRSAHALAGGVDEHGTVVTYGAVSREPLHIGNAHLIFRNLTFRGFWMTDWYRRVGSKEVRQMFSELLPMLRDGLAVPIEKTYPLESAREAIRHAAQEGRRGKVLLVMA